MVIIWEETFVLNASHKTSAKMAFALRLFTADKQTLLDSASTVRR